MNAAPIGVFDSGIGGLSVWIELHKGLPHESLIYYGDGKNCPYGNKTREEVISHVDFAVQRLLRKGVKMIVLACNAATAMAVDVMREKYPQIPFVGLEPAVKPAAMRSRSGVIGVLATAATLKGRHFMETSQKYSSMVEIVPAVGEGFVELVESDKEDSPEAFEAVENATREMISRGADIIVLGCTHYPFLEGALEKAAAGKDIIFLNPAEAIEHRVDTLLDELLLRAPEDNVPKYTFMSSADEEYRRRLEAKAEKVLEKI